MRYAIFLLLLLFAAPVFAVLPRSFTSAGFYPVSVDDLPRPYRLVKKQIARSSRSRVWFLGLVFWGLVFVGFCWLLGPLFLAFFVGGFLVLLGWPFFRHYLRLLRRMF